MQPPLTGVNNVRKIQLLSGLVVITMACSPPVPPAIPDSGEDGGVVVGGADAGNGDAGLFEIYHRDAGELILDSGLPWKWSAVEEVISAPPTGNTVTGRWIPVSPTSVDRAWAGGVLLLDGRVVAIPFNESSVLVINPATNTSERWPITGGAVAEGWQGGVLLPDGKVIAFPRNANRFLRIDPVARTVTPFGDDLSDTGLPGGIDKFRGGVLSLNGQVYAAPSMATFIARLNPDTGTITRVPIPPTIARGRVQGAVLFPTGDIVMWPSFDMPGLLLIPGMHGAPDEVWLMPRPPVGEVPAFNAGGVVTGIENAVAPPHQNAMPLRYKAGVLSWDAPLPGVSPRAANAWFFAAWSTNGHFYAPPFGQEEAISFSRDGAPSLLSFDPGDSTFRSVLGVVALPDGRIIGIPHARSAWLELSPAGRRTLPLEAFTSPYLNKL